MAVLQGDHEVVIVLHLEHVGALVVHHTAVQSRFCRLLVDPVLLPDKIANQPVEITLLSVEQSEEIIGPSQVKWRINL